jgi:PAS domain S-box-containing protein
MNPAAAPRLTLPGVLLPDDSEMVRRVRELDVTRILESITDGFMVIDAEWRITYMNPIAKKLLSTHDVDPATMLGARFFDLFPDVWSNETGRQMLRAMTERVPVGFENYYAPWEMWFFCRFDPLPDGGVAHYYHDITDAKRTEVALQQSEERFRRYFELGVVGMAITSPTKGCLAVNDRICEILGYCREELLHKTWAEMSHPDDLAFDLAQFQRVMGGAIDSYSLEKRWIRKDGRVIDGLISVSCVRRLDRSVDYFVALLDDVTERKQVEKALRESEARYRSLVSQVKDYAIFSTDERGVVTTWNEGCQEVLGYTEQEFVGLDFAELFTAEQRTDGLPAANLHDAAKTGTAHDDRWMLAKEGRLFFGTGATTALRDSAGRLVGFSKILRDVTSMKLAQDVLAHRERSLERLVTERTHALEKATERLRISERMASLGTLAAGLGHDLGNLLLPLEIRVQLLQRGNLSPELHEHVAGIESCLRYLQNLSSGLRQLATDPQDAPSAEPTEIGEWWNEVEILLKNVLPRGVTFDADLPRTECWVAIGRVSLTQAVLNLVQNAADALSKRGTGNVRVGVEDDPRAGMVTIGVTDDGPGMTDDVAGRCMEPYFTTKSRGLSTGVGLPLVCALAAVAGGRVEIDSTIGVGTTVRLVLRGAILPERISERAPRQRKGVAAKRRS